MSITIDHRRDKNSTAQLLPVKCFLHHTFVEESSADIADQCISAYAQVGGKVADPTFDFHVDWESEKRSTDINWRMKLQGWTFLYPVISCFDSSEAKQELLQSFLEVLKEWWALHGDTSDGISSAQKPKSYAWSDLSVGLRALACAFFLGRIRHFELELSEADAYVLNIVIMKHVQQLSSPSIFNLNNHGLYRTHGLMALTYSLPLQAEERDTLRSYALAHMEDLVGSLFDKNGIHREHSPAYHFYATEIIQAIDASGWYNASTVVSDCAEKAQRAKKWIADPLQQPLRIGDSIPVKLHTSLPTTALRDEFNKPLAYISSDFHDSGYAVVRSNWNSPVSTSSMLFMMGMHHSTIHKHRDCLSFEWFESGEKVICDSGAYSLKQDNYANYFTSTRAHNSLEIEGLDVLKMKPYGSAIESTTECGKGIYKITGALKFAAITHARTIYFKPRCWLIIIDDCVFAKARTVTQWFHTDPAYRLTQANENAISLQADERSLFIDCLDSEAAAQIHHGDVTNLQGFFCNSENSVSAGTAIGFKFFAKDKRIISCLALGKDERKEALDFVGSGFDTTFGVSNSLNISTPNVLPGISHKRITPGANLELGNGEGTFEVLVNNVNFHFYANMRESNKLIIMLPGATNREKGHLDFQRYSWSKNFDCSVIAFTDPSIKSSNDLSIAWFQNHVSAYGIEALGVLIKKISNDTGYATEDIALFGSSGGGFTALQLANTFPDSPVIAINPQTYLYNYSRPHFEKMVQRCYPGMSPQKVINDYRSRLVVDLDPLMRKQAAYIFQNIHDEKHLNLHTKLLLKSMIEESYSEQNLDDPMRSDRTLHVIYYADKEAGHTPPNKEDTISIINSVRNVLNF